MNIATSIELAISLDQRNAIRVEDTKTNIAANVDEQVTLIASQLQLGVTIVQTDLVDGTDNLELHKCLFTPLVLHHLLDSSLNLLDRFMLRRKDEYHQEDELITKILSASLKNARKSETDVFQFDFHEYLFS